jgi:hypothetical protein
METITIILPKPKTRPIARRPTFQAVKNDDGSNWPIAEFGSDHEGNDWSVTTDHVRASELYIWSKGADDDAQLVARLLNWYHMTPDAEEIINGEK